MGNDTAPPSTGRTAATEGRLRGSLGVGAIVFMVVAAAAPLTVVAGTVPIGIAAGNGPAFPITYVVCCVILLLFAVGFTAMARHVPQAGGFYAYIGRGLGRSAGLSAAFLALLTYLAVLIAVYGYIGAAVKQLIGSDAAGSVPWWGWSAVILGIVAVLGYRQIDLSGKVLGVLLLAEVAVVLLVDAFVVGRGGGPEGLSTASFHLHKVLSGAPGIALMFALAGFLGFEATVVFRDEARNPRRTIPRATYLALLLIGVFYALSSWAVVSAWGDNKVVAAAGANPGGLVAQTAQLFVGRFAADMVRVLLVSSLTAAVLSFHNVGARYLFSLGNTGVLPRRYGRSHAKHGSPHVASVQVSIVSVAMVAAAVALRLDPVAQVFAWLAGVATVGVVALMLGTCLAVVVFFRRHDLGEGRWRTVIAPTVGLVALAGCLYLTISNLPLLVGGSGRLALVIELVLLATVVAGPVVARARPHVSAHLPSPAIPEPSTT
jgi:amino acid transporter